MKKLTTLEKAVLNGIEVEQQFVTSETVNAIREAFKLTKITTAQEIIELRNAIVEHYNSIIDTYISADGREYIKQRDEAYDNAWTRMSMVTAVIDHTLYNLSR